MQKLKQNQLSADQSLTFNYKLHFTCIKLQVKTVGKNHQTFNFLNQQFLKGRVCYVPTPHASSNSFNLKFSGPVVEKNENAASNWAGVLICKIQKFKKDSTLHPTSSYHTINNST